MQNLRGLYFVGFQVMLGTQQADCALNTGMDGRMSHNSIPHTTHFYIKNIFVV